MMNLPFTDVLLGILALILVVAAVIDARTYIISNRLNLTVAALAPLYWWASALPLWPDAAVQVGVAVAVLLVLALAFYAGMMGGGDVKLAAALTLWFPPYFTVKFLILMAMAGGVLTLLLLVAHRVRRRPGRPKIPYGVAIAAGGLAVLAERYLNHFA